MECEEVRAALSARLDGEPTGVDDAVVDAHLSACESCRRWFEQAVALNRSLNVGPAPTVDVADVDLSEQILLTVEPERRRRERTWFFMTGTARFLLVVLGALWCVWGIVTLIDASSLAAATAGEISGAQPGGAGATVDPVAVGAAAGVQLAAIRVGLGVGLFWASWRTRAAMGMAPVYGAVAMFSFGFAARDLVLGTLGLGDAGGLLLMLLSAISLGFVWLGGYTPTALAQAWRAASGQPVSGLPFGR